MPHPVTDLRDTLKRKLAGALGIPSPSEPQEAEEEDQWNEIPGRKAQRAAGVRKLARPRRRPRVRATPHPLAAVPLGKVTPEAATKRASQVQRLQTAYNHTAETGGTWIAPDVEQAYRDRRAARSRARAGRRAARSR